MIIFDRNNHWQRGNGAARACGPMLSIDAGPSRNPMEIRPGSMGDCTGLSVNWELRSTRHNLEKPMISGLNQREDGKSNCSNSKMTRPALDLAFSVHRIVFYCC